jgi:predicted DNA-binding transcriptional regulator YafY
MTASKNPDEVMIETCLALARRHESFCKVEDLTPEEKCSGPSRLPITGRTLNKPGMSARPSHTRERLETEPDGSIILALKVADLDEIKRWLIGFGAEAGVLAPSELWKDFASGCGVFLRQPGPSPT